MVVKKTKKQAHKNSPSTKRKANSKNMKMRVGLLALAIVATAVVLKLVMNKPDTQKTYFSYTAEETAKLKDLKATGEINLGDVYQWDQKYFRLIAEQKLNDVEVSRLLAYIGVAEADFSALSLNAHGKYTGSINPVALGVACEFFPNECATLSIDEQSDEFSKQATELIVSKIKIRRAEDQQMTKPHSLSSDSGLWHGSGTEPEVGIDAGSRKPWHITSGSEFRVAPPPAITSDDYKVMLAQVNTALHNITEQQRQAVVFWAGGPGTKTPPGIWLNIADQYMKDQSTNLETVMKTRADVTTAMADAVIAVFDSKYTYQQKRPFMLDPTIITVMPTPNHPSYPAGHATISGAAYTVLSHYFPEHKTSWKQQADEASNSRLWGGIHFPIDNTAGFDLGEKVGSAAVKAE
jgi:hypothetical protein